MPTWIIGGLSLETIACAVGTIQVGYAISNMEPVSLVKLRGRCPKWHNHIRVD